MSTNATTMVHVAQVGVELEEAAGIIADHHWHIDCAELESALKVRAYIASPIDREIYLYEFTFDHYPTEPPTIDMIDVRTGKRNTPSAFPTTKDSLYHSNNLICAQFNRGAYKDRQGPHPDWVPVNWQAAMPSVTSIGEMLSLFSGRLMDPESYRGRRSG